jgi:hypothetical protein
VRRAAWLGLLLVLALPAPAFASRIDGGHVPARAAPWVSKAAVHEARAYARRRAGRVSFALAEPGGRMRGLAAARDFPSASVVKAMLLVAVLRAHRHAPVPREDRALLAPMIRYSDNDAASTVYAHVGGDGLRRVAHAARMRRFADVGDWAGSRITAADQARLFLRLDAVVPPRHRRYARGLLGGIVREQRWGIAAVADRHRLHILFKGGWRSDLAHQAARVEDGGRVLALVVLTDGDPATAYGEDTIRGVAERLLRRRPGARRGAARARTAAGRAARARGRAAAGRAARARAAAGRSVRARTAATRAVRATAALRAVRARTAATRAVRPRCLAPWLGLPPSGLASLSRPACPSGSRTGA